MTTSDGPAGKDAENQASATMSPDPVDSRVSGIKFDAGSVARAGVILMILVAALLLALWLFSVTRHFLFLILLAWLFAAALEPGIRAVMAHGPSRGVAAFAIGAGTLVLSFLLAVLFGRLFFDQISSLVLSIPGTASSVAQWLNDRFGMSIDANTMTSSLSLTPTNIQSWASALSGGVVSVVGSLSSVVFDLVTVLVFGFYFAGDGPTFFRAIASGMSPRRQRVFVTVTEITTAKTGDYVVSKIILAGLSTLFHGIFFVVIGVPYWLPFALLVGISAQFIPMVGTYIGIVLPVLAVGFVSPWKGVAIVAFAVVYQQIENYVFTPRVSAKTMNVNPAVALAAVFVGVAIWGPLGALIGIPLAAAGVAILETYRKPYDLVPEAAAHARGAARSTNPPS